MDAWTRELTEAEQRTVARARLVAWTLYEGAATPHRSCGIALAETFGLPTRPYQALRKGGLSGLGPCGAMLAGRLVLGEILGDPDPTGATTERLREAMAFYDRELPGRIDRMRAESDVCAELTGQFAEFASPERAAFCTRLATEAATLAAEALLRAGEPVAIGPIAGVDLDLAAPAEPGPAMPVLPASVAVYRTVRFTDETVPAGLLAAHTTKPGVWARIEVEEGSLVYRIREGLCGVFRLEPGVDGIVAPTVPHEVDPAPGTRFAVHFYREPSQGA